MSLRKQSFHTLLVLTLAVALVDADAAASQSVVEMVGSAPAADPRSRLMKRETVIQAEKAQRTIEEELGQAYLRAGRSEIGDAAINGYDPVSYQTLLQPELGYADISYRWRDKTWHFASLINRMIFQRNPARFVPEFEGHCAFQATQGKVTQGDPKVFAVLDSRLFLFESALAKQQWERDSARKRKPQAALTNSLRKVSVGY